jgi:hypothetical protein
MDQNNKAADHFRRLKLERTRASLQKRRIGARIFSTGEEVLAYLKAIIPTSATVGDSLTLSQIGVYEMLETGNYCYLNKYGALSREEKRAIYLKNFDADYFFSGVNAITEEGEIYNLDGNGSRVAPIIYGPKKVFLVVGYNKITLNEQEAISRIRNYAAPADAIRLEKNTPCAKTGKCADCRSADRICNYLTVVKGQFDPNRIEVLLLDLDLGF